jgi:hypothetical protein
MLTSATIDGLKALRLHAMAAALAEQNEQAGYAGLGFDERLGLLVDRELTDRASRRIQRSLKAARLRVPAAVEDIDFRHPRGLDRAQILDLAQAHWASNRRSIVITGPTGTGKTYLACALANAAIRNSHTALYQRAPRMLDELAIARGDGRLARLLGPHQRPGHRRPAAPPPHLRAGRRPARGHRGPGRAARHHHHQPAPRRHVAPGHRRPHHRRCGPGPAARQHRPDRADRRVHAPRARRHPPRPRTTAGPVMSGHPRPAIPRPPRSHDHAARNSCSQVTPGYRRPGRDR